MYSSRWLTLFCCCRGPSRAPDVRHGLSEPIRPRGLPPAHIPRVPAVRPAIPGPRMSIPGYVPNIRTTVPAAVPCIPAVPTLAAAPLPHHPAAFGAPIFDPPHPPDVPRSHALPMSEREFYKMQQKMKSR